MDDEFAKQQARSGTGGVGAGRSGNGAGEGSATSDEDGSGANEDEENEEEEDGPEFRGLKWKKDGKEVNEALVNDEVVLFFEVKNIGEGETVNVTIYEHDDDGEHDHIKDMTGTVKDGKVEIPWKVEYHDDDDDSNCAEEIEKYGYTIPEYFFVAEYGGVESEERKLLYVKGRLLRRLIDEITEEPLTNRKYAVYTPEGKFITGYTDAKGNIAIDDLKIGYYSIIS